MPRSCLTLTDCLTRRRPLLVVHFIPDASKAAREMRRVTKSGGVVATTMWEVAQANELNASLWEAAFPTDPKAKADVRGYRFQASAFRSLERPRLADIEVAGWQWDASSAPLTTTGRRLPKGKGLLELI